MTIMDGLQVFDQDVAITVTRDSTNVLDYSVARDMGIGDNPALKIQVLATTAFTAAGAATLTIALSGSPDNSSYTVMAQSPALPVASLAAGTLLWAIDVPRPVVGQPVPRYLKLVYTVATGPMTAGKVNSAIVLDRQDSPAYPAGITISN